MDILLLTFHERRFAHRMDGYDEEIILVESLKIPKILAPRVLRRQVDR